MIDPLFSAREYLTQRTHIIRQTKFTALPANRHFPPPFFHEEMSMTPCMMSLMMSGLTPEEILQTATACGISQIDWLTLHGSSAEHLREICDNASIRVIAHTILPDAFIQREDRLAFLQLKESIRAASILGARILMIPPFPRRDAISATQDRREWIDFLRAVAKEISAAGLIPSFESTGMPGSAIQSGDEVAEALAEIPELRLTFDAGNVAMVEDPVNDFRRFRDRICNVHLKDWTIHNAAVPGSIPGRDGRYYANALLGEGDTDLEALCRELLLSGYSGAIELETAQRGVDPRDAMHHAIQKLRSWGVIV